MPKASQCLPPEVALHHLTMNSKVGTDQAVGNTAWHADTGRERLQQGFHVIVCNVRPHLSLRLGAAAILPFFRSIIPSARIQPPCLLSLLFLKTVPQRRTSAWVPITSKRIPCDTSRNLHVTVFFRFLSQGRTPIWVGSSVALWKQSKMASEWVSSTKAATTWWLLSGLRKSHGTCYFINTKFWIPTPF